MKIGYILGENTKKLSVGVSQYNNIVPKNGSVEENTKKIGYYASS